MNRRFIKLSSFCQCGIDDIGLYCATFIGENIRIRRVGEKDVFYMCSLAIKGLRRASRG